MQDKNNFPLFPLGIVLLPGMVIPLHIFEERYKQMVNKCTENKQDFGMVYYSGNKMYDSGCSAEILEIITTHPDGRMDILIEGKQRFKINSTNSDQPYLQGNIVFFDDQYELEGPSLEKSKEEGISLLKDIISLYDEKNNTVSFDEFDPKTVSFLLTSNSAFTMDEKQSFLEMINTKERLEKAVKSLKIIVERIKVAYDIGAIIQSNGYLPKKHH